MRRRRLAEMLDAGVCRPVTLVCAGPGWGKSALVASWAEARVTSGPIAWLTLSAQHNDPRAFWSDLVMALRMSGAVPGGNPLEQLDLGIRADQRAVARVLDGLDALPQPVVLVLDDFHEVDDARVLGGLTTLLHDPPPALRLVLIARTEPTLPLHRFRAGGELTEIRTRHLAFRPAEAAELPAVHRRRMPVDELTALLDRTEGWVVGLQLLADVRAERGAPANGEVRAASDYLLREVVGALPARTRQFLVRASVPDQMCGPLADALTGETNSRRILEGLESSNAFVVRVEERPGWYRCHPMLRDALLHQLLLDRPGAAAELHLLAADWYARQDSIFEALRHAADAGDWRYLGRLAVERAMVRVMCGDQLALVEVLRRIPPEEHASTAELALCGAAVRYASGDRAGVAGLLRLARSLTGRQAEVPAATDLTLRLMEAGILNWRVGDMPGLIAKSTETLRTLAAYRQDELPSLLHYRAIALNEKGAGLLWMDRADQADRYLWAASMAARGVGSTVTEVNAMAHLGLLVFLQGSLNEAAEHVSAALDLARRNRFETSAQASVSYLTSALIQIERDRVGEAQEALRKALRAGGDEPAAAPGLLAALVRVHLLLAAGDPAAARALLRLTREEAPVTLVAPVLAHWLRLAESEADLALGCFREVVARYDREAPHGVLTASEQVCLARALLSAGDHAAAELLLARVRESTDRVAAVTAWIATAFAADAEGHGNRSIDALSRALLIAERDEIRRPFRRFDQRRLAVLLDRRRWVEEHTAASAVTVARAAGSEPPAGTLDVLSERERDVLRYLPTVLTAGEIAANLNISINTVKAHMRSIYRKLGAARRREAVVRARQLGLL
ncbi:LuxR C-terminal-related transcriptional regulator [Actinoplanes sp. KI2]|uniref:LuxR C-terminal-related transcriptional regulator n=1 Tax=Actinoplanes sp. KI2 TaxID=2983315 RepID=UPI0021D5C52A|nr:LuxR C-terminal-related transcriptional regulator [Actinoplanes sp. KI2]MCU7730449.1 LuxR C-terminal-related transcriptional regulator [Actinoplanes sp. KI2]